jgi:hypothetical protein
METTTNTPTKITVETTVNAPVEKFGILDRAAALTKWKQCF